tara:strand:+ start:24773 stop:25132 length:360 start_codon:yes stop_codon:yes gene_type:complete
MSLMPAYYTTNNTKKRKHKKSQKQVRAEQEHQAFIESLKSSHGGSGRRNGLKIRYSSECEGSSPSASTNSISYHSSMAKKEEKVYTGTEIIGIAQMHKSNAVPIRSKKTAEEVARMRRG